MLELSSCYKYEPEIKRITKANSFLASGRVIYIVKKDHKGKTIKIFNAYDKESKTQLSQHWDKDKLIKYLQRQDLTILGESLGQQSLF